MKHSFALLAAVLGVLATSGLAQAPAPVAVPVAPIKLPPTTPAATPQALIQQLQIMRDANAKLIEQQAKTLAELEEMEKTAQQIKLFGKRS